MAVFSLGGEVNGRESYWLISVGGMRHIVARQIAAPIVLRVPLKRFLPPGVRQFAARQYVTFPRRCPFPRMRTVSFSIQVFIKGISMKNAVNCLAIVSCFTLSITLAHACPNKACPTKDGGKMHGQAHGQMGGKMFENLDANGDGAIARDEFDAFHAKHFKEMDSNGDGKISRDEMDAGHKKMMEKSMDKSFDEADANHDGALTREEAKVMPMLSSHFDGVDANHDGKVSREERDAAMKKMHHGGEEKKPLPGDGK